MSAKEPARDKVGKCDARINATVAAKVKTAIWKYARLMTAMLVTTINEKEEHVITIPNGKTYAVESRPKLQDSHAFERVRIATSPLALHILTLELVGRWSPAVHRIV